MKKILLALCAASAFSTLSAIDVDISLPNVRINSGNVELWSDEYRGYSPRSYYIAPPPPPPPPHHKNYKKWKKDYDKWLKWQKKHKNQKKHKRK